MIPKFRAYLKERPYFKGTGIIVDVQEINYKYEEIVYENGRYTEVADFKDIELLQSTGLKDKNGVEIFEGDIVKDVNGELGYIAFLKQEMGYVIVYKNRDRRLGHRNGIDDFHLETIGNKYEHPHLLKE